MFHPEYINPQKLITNQDILILFNAVEKHGGVLRFVGGAVRDAIAGFDRKDIDLVTDMSPSEFSDMCDDEGLKCVPIGIQFFTIGVIVNGSFFKVTSLSEEEDNGKDEWKTDASCRDLTINAVYADEKGNVFDYYNGIKDLENGVIKFIGKPQDAIERDYIRIMRFFRFYAMFGRNIDKKSLNACIENKHLLHKVSSVKIREELFKIFMAPYALNALKVIFENGILDFMVAAPNDLNNLEKLNNLVNKLGLEKNIIRCVFAAFNPESKRAYRLADIFHFSKEQKDHFIALAKSKLSLNSFKDTVSINKSVYKYGKDLCKDMWLYLNLDSQDIKSIKDVLNSIDNTNLPSFPIKGKDLLDLGIDAKTLGLYMDALKKEWIENGCLLSKDELIQKYAKSL